MKKVTKNHILPPSAQKENDFNALRDIITMDDIDYAIEILYLSYNIFNNRIINCSIEECMQRAIKEHKENLKINTDD